MFCCSKVWAFPLSLYFILGVENMSSFYGPFLFPSVSLSPSDLRRGGAVHCPKLLKLSRDILRSVDATKCDGAELLGLYSRLFPQ